MEHPTRALIADLTGELGPGERELVEAHLARCPECGREREAMARLLGGLRAAAAAAPEIQWSRWRAELRARLKASPRRRWAGPVPLVLSGGLAGLLVMAVWLGGQREAPRPDLAAIEHAPPGEQLTQHPLLEDLELLENLELISHLDQLTPPPEG
jgi:anti-sigma factor RsiW